MKGLNHNREILLTSPAIKSRRSRNRDYGRVAVLRINGLPQNQDPIGKYGFLDLHTSPGHTAPLNTCTEAVDGVLVRLMLSAKSVPFPVVPALSRKLIRSSAR